MVRPIIRGKSYVVETGKSMKAVELALSPNDSWRKIPIALIDFKNVECGDEATRHPSDDIGGPDREVSREKNDKGEPQYEATVFVGWNEKTREYACVWMDVYGGATSESIGLATPKENELAFVFTDEHGETSFTNTFIYDPKTNTWGNRLDNVVKGEAKPFARFKLTKQ